VDIFTRYLTAALPIHEVETRQHGGDAGAAVNRLIAATVAAIYSLDEENRFLEVTYANGDKEILYADFASGTMIESVVVRRAKTLALKRYIQRNEKGITSKRPARRGPGGVQGARGSTQHEQPGRLGKDRRQE
jgi:proteasome-associated ATPase